ncbi:acyl--CoA ligase [Ruficoccus amylovorans]|uniref:Acyl--CoA ligase n=1 Tax=Ruficoccus amylovorans TaxID=1804625 RepID=A0A842HFH2_9BACT|nr:class I adenylate-forming enzyme family protein [Ruficoccus amylovorans]MBC2594386.1 acyl--CoA ligase [Ruficoccus amylovorans]
MSTQQEKKTREASDPLLCGWEAVLRRQGERLAVIDAATGAAVSFIELEARARDWETRLAPHQLNRRGVVFRLPNGADWLAAFIALRRAGAVVIPLDAGAPAQELATAQRLLAPALQVTEGGLETLSGSRHWKAGTALVKLTSGSTGAPKPIPFTGGELCADAANILSTMGFGPDDLNFALLPFAHSYALGNLVAPLLAFGVPLVVGSAAFPHVIAEEVARYRATVLPTVPAVLEGLCRGGEISLKPLRLVISAAAPLSPDLARRFYEATGLLVHNFYGSSETGGIAYDRDGHAGLKGDCVGTAMDGVRLTRMPDGRLRVCSAAVSSYGSVGGEMSLTGEAASAGKKSLAAFTLADRVSFTETGGVVIHGRADRIVKCAGVRLDLARLEQVTAALDGVRQAVAFYEPEGERLLLAYEGDAQVAAVLAGLRAAFPRLGRRLQVRRLEVLPRTARGKIDQRALRRGWGDKSSGAKGA